MLHRLPKKPTKPFHKAGISFTKAELNHLSEKGFMVKDNFFLNTNFLSLQRWVIELASSKKLQQAKIGLGSLDPRIRGDYHLWIDDKVFSVFPDSISTDRS